MSGTEAPSFYPTELEAWLHFTLKAAGAPVPHLPCSPQEEECMPALYAGVLCALWRHSTHTHTGHSWGWGNGVFITYVNSLLPGLQKWATTVSKVSVISYPVSMPNQPNSPWGVQALVLVCNSPQIHLFLHLLAPSPAASLSIEASGSATLYYPSNTSRVPNRRLIHTLFRVCQLPLPKASDPRLTG